MIINLLSFSNDNFQFNKQVQLLKVFPLKYTGTMLNMRFGSNSRNHRCLHRFQESCFEIRVESTTGHYSVLGNIL